MQSFVGVDGSGLIGMLAEPVVTHDDGVVTVSVSVTVPEAPAVYVTFCAVLLLVIDPLLIDHE